MSELGTEGAGEFAGLAALVTGEDGTPDGGLVHAVAALGLPQADRGLAAQVIARATGAQLSRAAASSVRKRS